MSAKERVRDLMRVREGICIGIDASNLRAGGGVTHLVELLRAADPAEHGIAKVVVWGCQSTLARLEPRPWLETRPERGLEGSILVRALWQHFRLSHLARTASCDVLFVPGGRYRSDFNPIVTMSRNMLPFEWKQLRRYGWSFTTLRLLVLRWSQMRGFRRAEGVIFLTRYARDAVRAVTGPLAGHEAIIPHGVHERFHGAVRIQRAISTYSWEAPFRILYVSIVDVYKHQPEVVEAVSQLRGAGLPVSLELIGPAYPPALARLRATMSRVDPAGAFVHYMGSVPNDALMAHYSQADLCLFASSCENMPNILLEGMATGLPIACSRLGPMPEVLEDAGLYFDPEDPDDISRAVRALVNDPGLRAALATASQARARRFTWSRCAKETMSLLSKIAGGDRACEKRQILAFQTAGGSETGDAPQC